MRFNSDDITKLLRACKVYQDQTGSEFIWDEYQNLIERLEYYREENCEGEYV